MKAVCLKTNVNVGIVVAKYIQPRNALWIAHFHWMLEEQCISTQQPSAHRNYSICSDEKHTVIGECTKTHTFLGKYFRAKWPSNKYELSEAYKMEYECSQLEYVTPTKM